MSSNRLRYGSYTNREQTKTEMKEKNWDQRFFLYKIPPYDAFKDSNYLSLGLMKSKIKYERYLEDLEKEKIKKLRGKTPKYTEHYVIDSQSGFKTMKEKKKKLLFSATFQKENDKNNKNDFARTYNNKFGGLKKNQTQESQLSVEEVDLLDEFDIIKTMWSKLGVTKSYQENFINFINNLDDLGNIRLYLDLEQKQMQKFKYDLSQLIKKIIHRNDQIANLKQLIKIYENILKEKRTHPELENENLDSLCNKNEKQVIDDINSCLIYLRISTINVVNQIKTFLMSNSFFLYMNKINLEQIKNDYYYNDEYLLSIKSDLDFVQQSILTKLYDFDNFDGGDPFFLSFSKIKEEEENPEGNKNNQKRKLEINKKVLEEVQSCIFFMLQAEILYKNKNANKNNANKNKVLEFLKYGNKNEEENSKKKSYGIGSLFKGNIEKDIVKLRNTKAYNNIFSFIKPNNSNPYLNLNKENRLKKSSKNRKNIQLMTSQELKKKFSQYELLNELINQPNNEVKKEEEFKKRDQEVNINNIEKNEEKKEEKNEEKKEEKKEDSQEHYSQNFDEKKEENQNKEETNDKVDNKETQEAENEKEKEKKDEEIDNKEEKPEDIEKKEENKELNKIDEKEENIIEEKIEERFENKIEEKEEEKLKYKGGEFVEETVVKKEEENDKKNSESKIVEIVDDIFKEAKKGIKEIEIPTYKTLFYTESLDKLSLLYNDYISKNANVYTTNTPNKSKDFLIGIYPKIIIAKKENDNEEKIYGICGINYYIDENKENILKINHISVCDNNKDILNQFFELIEKEIKYKIIEIELDKNNRDNDTLIEILKNKGFKDYQDSDDKTIMRKENNNAEINEIGSIINYDSLGILSIINKSNNENKNEKYNCFDKVMNPIMLSLLIDKLKINDLYKVELISSYNSKTELIEKLSKLGNKVFDFIKSQNNDCKNINKITNNEIIPKEGFNYSMLNNLLNIQMNTLMTLYIDNYSYNALEINVKNNLIIDQKYNNNLYILPTNNKNVFIVIYQYNEEFETFMNKDKDNIYNQFTSLFKIMIKNYISEDHNDNDDNNKKILWIPSFNINTNLFSSGLEINKHINILNFRDEEVKIDEFNEFLKINYLPDSNIDKNIEMNANRENDIIIKNKFLFGI